MSNIHTSHKMVPIPYEANRMCGACFACECHDDLSGECVPAFPLAEPTTADAVQAERDRQNAKWGEQNHPDGTGPGEPVLGPIAAYANQPRLGLLGGWAMARLATHTTNQAAVRGDVTWRDILLEEVFEALAEGDPAKLQEELIQVAAVAQQWIDAIKRRES